MLCPSCQKIISDLAICCPECGGAVKSTESTGKSFKKCPLCGTENDPEARFCKIDRFSLLQVDSTSSKKIAPASNDSQETFIDTANVGIISMGEVTDSAPEPKKPTHKQEHDSLIIKEKSEKANKPKDGTVLNDMAYLKFHPPQKAEREKSQQRDDFEKEIGEAEKPVEKEYRSQPDKNKKFIWAAAGILFVIVVGAAGYWYFPGIFQFRKNPESLQAAIDRELRGIGLSQITVLVDNNRKAKINGVVKTHSDKERVMAILRGHKDIKGIVDNLQVTIFPGNLERAIRQVLEREGLAGLTVRVNDSLEAEVGGRVDKTEARDRALTLVREFGNLKKINDNIRVEPREEFTPGITPKELGSPKPFNRTSRKRMTVTKTLETVTPMDSSKIREEINMAFIKNGLTDVHIDITQDRIAVLSGNINTDDEKTMALLIVRSHKEIQGIKDQIRIKPAGKSIDPLKEELSRLEDQINLALRNQGVVGIRAVAKDDQTISINGSVKDFETKKYAIELAKSYAGNKKIKDMIFVVKP